MTADKTILDDLMKRRVKEPGPIAILSHVNPDGDALGSALALSGYFHNAGIACSVIMPNEYPDFLKWLPGNKEVIVFSKNKNVASRMLENASILFMLDFNTRDRAGILSETIMKSDACKVLIDHHPDPENFADIVFSDVRSSSTAELIYRFIELSGDPELINSDVATCLYAGIMSDTGSFSYNSSQPETYRVLSELLRKGIDKDHIYSMIYDNFSEYRFRLLGYCLDKKMVVLKDYKTAYISLTMNEKKQYRYIRGDSEGFVNYPLSIKGIDFAVFFMENDDHVKISFRSKGKFDTNSFAVENFDGGGHVNASGGESRQSLDETIERFVSLLPQYFK